MGLKLREPYTLDTKTENYGGLSQEPYLLEFKVHSNKSFHKCLPEVRSITLLPCDDIGHVSGMLGIFHGFVSPMKE